MVLVETSEEDSFVLVAQHVAELLAGEDEQKSALVETQASKFLDECTTMVAESRLDGYISKVLEHLELVFTKSPDKDCECVANILVQATMRLPQDKAATSINALSSALTSKLDDRAEERLSALLNLYGSSSSAGPAIQLQLLLSSLQYACRHPRLATVVGGVVRGHAEEWVRAWKLNDSQAMELYLALAALAKASQSKVSAAEYLKLATAALALGKPEDAGCMEKLKSHAVAAVTDFIRSPTAYHCDLAELPVMKALVKDAQCGGLITLLNVILAGDLAGFKTAATPAVLELAGITAETALYKARMVALLSLGRQAANEELSFAEVQKALDIPADQVEIWLVRAIGSKLIEGKIDQVRSVVVITRCTLRTFGPNDWVAMRSKLATWKENLEGVQANFDASKGHLRGAGAIKA